MNIKLLTLSIFTCVLSVVSAQSAYYKLGFVRNQEVEVKKNNQKLQFPWVGGLNSVYFSQIDLNLDGISDFMAFEKHGNKILPFINNGTNTNPQFVYAPEYKHCFPELQNWVVLKDFNNDGKADIFTYNGLGGIRVFENVSNQKLTFKLVVDPVKSNYYGSEVNIFASPDDYLGIADIFGTGKLDILNFWVLGKFVHLQKNISQYNDFFKYALTDECWGNFSEAADNNEITLFTNCEGKSEKSDRHVGSSIFVHDFNADGLQDIIIGDVDFPRLKLLINGGTQEEANMVSQTENFPNAQNPVHIYSMPAVSTMNFWNAEQPDLFVSPSDPSLTKSEDHNSVWHYRYNAQLKDYLLETKSYLQEDMMDVGSGATPVLFDWNNDGLLDLFVANYGSFDSANYQQGILKSYYSSSIAYYKNVGTKNNPKFEWVTSDFGGLKKFGYLGLYPTFADLSGDGKIDLLCGNSDGSLLFFENTAALGDLPQFKPVVNSYQNIKVDAFSTPQLFDIDKDGKLDLVLGNRRGILSYYQHTGTSNNPNFQLVTANFGNVDVRDPNISYFGYATPHLFSYNNETLLVCGNEQGNLFLFSNIDNNLAGEFTCLEKLTETIQNKAYRINEGIRVAATVADLTGDNKPDLIVGNWAGGMSFFQGNEPAVNMVAEINFENINVYPNPTTGILNIILERIETLDVRYEILDVRYEILDVRYEIFDIYGRKHQISPELNSGLKSQISNQINISQLAAGVYFVKIYTKSGEVMKKVVKM